MNNVVVDSQPGAKHPPMFIVIVGGAFLALFVVGFMTQIQTNEAFISHAGQVNVYQPDWAVLWQIPSLLLGQLDSGMASAAIFGWGIELIYLGFVIGHEILVHSVQRSGQTFAKMFQTLSWAIIGFNMFTDFQYGTLGGGFWGHVGFSLITSFIVGYFGTIGMTLVQIGWKKA